MHHYRDIKDICFAITAQLLCINAKAKMQTAVVKVYVIMCASLKQLSDSLETNIMKEAGFGGMAAHQGSSDFILKHIIRI